jgi:hypothetical protein
MKNKAGKADYQSLMTKALMQLREIGGKFSSLEQAHSEQLVIVGMGCRFLEDADNPETFWQLLTE